MAAYSICKVAYTASLPPYLQPGTHRFTDGANFASAGAGVLVETHPGTIQLRLQLSYFKAVKVSLKQKLGDEEAKNVGKYVKMVIANLTSVPQEIYDLGERKIAFQNAGPLGCLPAMKNLDPKLGSACAEESSSLARLHNRYLYVVLKKLENQLPGCKYSIFDYYNALGDRVNNPSKYGFKKEKAACCGSGAYRGGNCGGTTITNGTKSYQLCSKPGEYVWFDGGHTTETANFQLAKLLWSGEPKITGPYNMKQLFSL
ncbi:hypothetical protein ACOSQ4_020182 [Xanthoceras sorbifolium]